jgi:peroxiredoxin
MQILKLFLISSFLFLSNDDVKKVFPIVELSTLEGKTVSTKDFIGKGNPVLVSMWATWCAPCKRELDNIADLYPEWKEKYGLEILAVTIDNSRQLRKVPGIVSSKGWEYTILSDENGNLQQTMGVATIPQTYLVNGDGEIIYDHNGYAPGDEEEIGELLEGIK